MLTFTYMGPPLDAASYAGTLLLEALAARVFFR